MSRCLWVGPLGRHVHQNGFCFKIGGYEKLSLNFCVQICFYLQMFCSALGTIYTGARTEYSFSQGCGQWPYYVFQNFICCTVLNLSTTQAHLSESQSTHTQQLTCCSNLSGRECFLFENELIIAFLLSMFMRVKGTVP